MKLSSQTLGFVKKASNSKLLIFLKNVLICTFWTVFLVSFFVAAGETLVEIIGHSALKETAAKFHKEPRELMSRMFGAQIYAFSLMISVGTVFGGVMYGSRTSQKDIEFQNSLKVPKDILREISYGVWGAIIVAATTAIVWVTYITSGPVSVAQYTNEISGLEALTVVVMAYCIYRKSMVSAVMLVLYFVLTSYMKIIVQHQLTGSNIAIAMFMVCFSCMGVIGTFRYRQFVSAARKGASPQD